MYEKATKAQRIEASERAEQAWKSSRKDAVRMLTDYLGGKPTSIETAIAAKAFQFGYMKAVENCQNCEAAKLLILR